MCGQGDRSGDRDGLGDEHWERRCCDHNGLALDELVSDGYFFGRGDALRHWVELVGVEVGVGVRG